MYVIAKYDPDTSKHQGVMDLFRHHVCSIDVTPSGTVCHGKFSDEVFSDWYRTNSLKGQEWFDVEVRLVSESVIVVKGSAALISGYEIYVAEDDSVISVLQAKACGLWTSILDQLYEAVDRP